jgi:hypothetical protein
MAQPLAFSEKRFAAPQTLVPHLSFVISLERHGLRSLPIGQGFAYRGLGLPRVCHWHSRSRQVRRRTYVKLQAS